MSRRLRRLLVIFAAILVAPAAAALLFVARGGVLARSAPEAPGATPSAELERIPLERPPEPRPLRLATPAKPSLALGHPSSGRLVRGLQLPAEGEEFFTWDPIRRNSPNRRWRRWATDRLLRTIRSVLVEFRRRYPHAPRVGIGDLSRPLGGDFGPRFGLPGHASHQNGLDADIYYPRTDGRERPSTRPSQIDRILARELVRLFVAAGARYVFVGSSTGLRGPPAIVQTLAHHDDHLHVRIR